MASLRDSLSSVKSRILRYRDTPINEQNTKAALIEPILRALEWDVEDLDEVQREFKPKSADNPVDYALLVLRTPRLFVEAKALSENLDDRRWASQIMGYASVAGVEWVVLTNGNEYRIYNAHAPVPVEDKIFRTVRITDNESAAEETLSLLSKGRMQENQIEVLWRAYFVDRQVRNTINNLFSSEPDTAIVNLIRKRIPSLPPGDIKASLNRISVRFDFPVETNMTRVQGAGALQHAEDTGAVHLKPNPPLRQPVRVDVSLSDLIQAGLIVPPMILETTFKRQRLVARVESNGDVAFQSQTYHSLSVAAAWARNAVSGPPSNGRRYWQTNGWVFWQFKDDDGQFKLIDVLRKRYLERTGKGQ